MSVDHRSLVENLTLDRLGRRRRSVRRLWSFDHLPMPRAFFRGPKWKRLCGVSERLIADVDPFAAQYHRPGRKLLLFSFEDDVRERACVPIRGDVCAQWSDPREQLGLV
jgi:hypothetical protein